MNSKNFRPGKERFRASFAGVETSSPRFGEIDEEKGILHNVQVNLMGEAKGHGVWLGEDFIDGVVEQGNKASLGVKVRFGHPAMCSDALGTFLGRAKNFTKQDVTRADGSVVKGAFADIHLAEEAKDAPTGDLYTWTLGAAKNNPDTFGQSIVFTYSDFYVVDKDGTKHKWSEEPQPKERGEPSYDNWIAKSADGKQYALIEKLLGTDFTDSPAATDGVFGSDDLAAQADEMLEEHPQIMEVLTSKPDVLAQFIERYNVALEAAGKPRVMLAVIGQEGTVSIEDHEALKARFAGLQSAKDKEIAGLKEAAAAAKTDFDSQMAKLRADLGTAQADLSAKAEELAKAHDALAENRKQLATSQDALAKLTGDTLSSPETFASWKEAEQKLGYTQARKQCKDLYAAFMAGK